jgi:outer membrane protein TolC
MKSSSGNPGSGDAPNVNSALYGILNASLPVYAGGRVRYGIESARLLVKASELDADQDRDDVVENAVESFVNLYKARKAVDIVNESLTQANRRVTDFRNLEQNGLLARNDLLKAELQSSNTELTLLDYQNNLALANYNMSLLLGLPDSTELIPDSTSIVSTFQLGTSEEYVQSALSNRKDLTSVDLRKQAAEVGVKSTKAEYKPSLALTGGYVAAKIPNLITITNAANIGVGVSYNLASLWKTKAKVAGAEARVHQLEASQALLGDQVRIQVNRAYLNFLSSRKKIDVYAKAVEQATENLRIVTNKYNNALATPTDLLEAQVASDQAQLNYAFAQADAVVSYNQLLLAAGKNSPTNH